MRTAAVFLVFALAVLLGPAARADHYRAGDLQKLNAIPNWELVRQDFDVVTGENFGAPTLVKRYDTLAACDKAQRGRISRPRNVGIKWVVGEFVCRHKTADEV